MCTPPLALCVNVAVPVNVLPLRASIIAVAWGPAAGGGAEELADFEDAQPRLQAQRVTRNRRGKRPRRNFIQPPGLHSISHSSVLFLAGSSCPAPCSISASRPFGLRRRNG